MAMDQQPLCNSTSGCSNLLFTVCNQTDDGQSRCMCILDYIWNSTSLNCTHSLVNVNPPKTDDKSGPKPNSKAIIYGILSAIIVIATITVLFVYIKKKLSAPASSNEPEPEVQLVGRQDEVDADEEEDDIRVFTFEALSGATAGFSEDKKLGQGGFGPVYKGLLPGGEEIAVKRLLQGSSQGADEVNNEIYILRKLQHPNIVRLLGHCTNGGEKMLVYEYLPRKSLDKSLFDETTSVMLTWGTRQYIILGIAQGLLYLHQDAPFRVVHMDLKPGNILLDAQMNPKISDFGLSQILERNQSRGQARVNKGTYGFMAPEYALHCTYSLESDVYSFGAVMLEIITGKKISSAYDPDKGIIDLSGYAWSMWEGGKFTELLDATVVETCTDIETVKKYINVALLCLQKDSTLRPPMSQVVSFLGNDNNHESLPRPQRPYFAGAEDASGGSFNMHDIASKFSSLLKEAGEASTSAFTGG